MEDDKPEAAAVYGLCGTMLLLVFILFLMFGCSTQPLTEAQMDKVVDARLQDGSDETCWTVMGAEVWCRKRVRDVDE